MIRASVADIRAILEGSRVVAVLGAHYEPWRPAFYVPEYMRSVGSRIVPVNPALVGRTLWDEPVRGSLTEVGAVDVVDVFRRSDALMGHLDEILAMNPLPRVVWLQQGIRDDRFAGLLSDRGIDVVQDRCMLADHRHLGLGRIV